MRIDKYLWCVRLFKTRSLATNDVKNDRVLLGGEVAKPSREVKEGDEITIKYHGYSRSFKVLGWPKSRVGAKLVPDLLEETTPTQELEKQEFLKLAKNLQRDKGTGRPTKRERRDLDRLL
ncbi:RNA-binding S4 domain-containing protein [Phaeocystidibacter marisrubri]|uniref:RNA-binding S4 domain-containing protein n=1 Tax=Phaeocystidibacter marisrubri TaxID=1577780 RepID=A0A6L3ZGG0_9FLAO|nr:RNA-binding S4 domain-containing protein [Phaeocystidibacter marisrubri]KAB2816542.1 RNA-binding S4 domain-containing protein [Phaeocystidibacter marisrubri]GGH69581.1 RNA-binding protein S4 [Phaeocystidibacter marisrubri]